MNKHFLKIGDDIMFNGNPTTILDVNDEGVTFDNGTSTIWKWDRVNRLIEAGTWVVSPKIENTSQLIEVGDTVVFGTDMDPTDTRVVASFFDNGARVRFTNGGWMPLSGTKLVSKGEKKSDQEVISYELLKELPGISQGTKLYYNTYRWHVGNIGGDNHYSFTTKQLEDRNWFKPIYKPKDLVVTISGDRSVIISDNLLKFTNTTNSQVIGEAMSFQDFYMLRDHIAEQNKIYINTKNKRYKLTILSFKVGCQDFSEKDITTIQHGIAVYLMNNGNISDIK